MSITKIIEETITAPRERGALLGFLAAKDKEPGLTLNKFKDRASISGATVYGALHKLRNAGYTAEVEKHFAFKPKELVLNSPSALPAKRKYNKKPKMLEFSTTPPDPEAVRKARVTKIIHELLELM